MPPVRFALLCLTLLVSAMTIGCAANAQPENTSPPTVSSLSVTPTALDIEGGPVAIALQATDDEAVTGVTVTVRLGAGEPVEIPVTQSASGFSASYTAPANQTDAVQTYTVGAVALDRSGNRSLLVVDTFEVAALEEPPLPPPAL